MGVAASTTIVGSGLAPLKRLLPTNPGNGEKNLRAINTAIINPEDASASFSGLNSQITVGTTAVKIPTTPLRYRRAICVMNNSASPAVLYIGFDSSVSTSTGFPITGGCSLPMDFTASIQLWGVSNTSVDCRILEVS